MHNRFLLNLFIRHFYLFLILFSISPVFSQEAKYKKGELLIQLNSLSDGEKLIKSYPQLKKLGDIVPEFNIIKVGFDHNSIDEKSLLNQLQKNPLIRHVQFNHFIAYRDSTPNDAGFLQQWSMNNTGQSGGNVDADIDAPEAWGISTGGLTALGDTIVVAVIDAGFDLNHNDLDYWKNYKEIPNNGVDDDLNGYIDDVDGWNAYNDNGTITSDSHGTHVSGIVGAKGNNTIGVAGVNWNAKVMAIQGDSNDESIVIKAYGYIFKQRKLYRETNGAKGAFVVSTNASFGVDYGNPADFPLWCGIYDSLGAIGILSAGATANLNIDVDQVSDIPTACTSNYLVTVTNTTAYDTRNSGAAYGLTTIDLGAPGTNIYSTVPGNSYQNMTGTSMATPHVAGAIALMYAAACSDWIQNYKDYPADYALMVKNLLLENTDAISALQGKTVSGGRLNIKSALLAVQKSCDWPLPPLANNDTNCISNTFTLSGTVGLNGTDLLWFDNINGQPIFVGDTFITPALTQSTVYYVASYDSVSSNQSILVPVTCTVITPQIAISKTTYSNTYQLNVTGAVTYSWTPATGLSCSDCPNPIATPADSITYYVYGTDSSGCIAVDSISLSSLTGIRESETGYFSFKIYPNPAKGDVVFEFSQLDLLHEKPYLIIYNSIGEEVYSLSDITSKKVIIKNTDFVPGIYFYQLKGISDKQIDTGKIVFLE